MGTSSQTFGNGTNSESKEQVACNVPQSPHLISVRLA
jgi:hypothetical protein